VLAKYYSRTQLAGENLLAVEDHVFSFNTLIRNLTSKRSKVRFSALQLLKNFKGLKLLGSDKPTSS